ncbi:MAG: protein translocase subunit SecD [Pseudomonadota bacterium]
MIKKLHRKFLFLGILVILGFLLCIPSLTSNLPDWGRFIPGRGIRLGLDLQGGMHLILKVNLDRAIQNHLDISVADLRDVLKKKKISVLRLEPVGTNRVRLHLSNQADPESVQKILSRDFPFLTVLTSSLTAGNGYLELGLSPGEVRNFEENAVLQSLEIIRNRIDEFGVSEPVIVRQGKDRIVVQLPGVKDPKRALELIGRTAQLEFKLVDTQAGLDLPALVSNALRSGRLKEGYGHRELNRALKGMIPADAEVYLRKEGERAAERPFTAPVLLKKKALMTGDAVKNAQVHIGGQYNEPYVGLSMNARGSRLFDRITGENVGSQLAIILDDVVQSAPVIRERISGGNAQISGSFTAEEAGDLAIVLRAGALPAPVDIVQNLTVGPSLGRDSIEKGIASAILGTLLVVAFMVIYYRLSGVIANLALFLNVILMVAALSLFQATLTLPGIAGIILSIGMAVDSNVLIFERMREEFAIGSSFKSAVDAGYKKALWTIVDSHVTTLITAFALFLFGTGPIKGFAVTLSLGVILNLFTALYGTRTAYDYLNMRRRIKNIRFLQIIRNPRIDFIKLRNAAFILSGVLVLLGLFAFVQIYRGKANLGVEFAGGTLAQFKAEKDFQLQDIRAVFARYNLKDVELQEVPKQRILFVRMKQMEYSLGKASDRVAAILAEEMPQHRFTLESKSEIGASVTRDLKRAALVAIAVSLVGIILYLAWRFNLRFGVAAAAATFHDVLAVLGIFYLMDKETTLLVVTALLTLAGYSLSDTVVVFDRIREHMGRKGRKDLGEVINQSINEVLSRTIVTSATVFLVLLSLLFIGGAQIHDFALALTIGVIVGTYSSIFVASPIIYIWKGSRT